MGLCKTSNFSIFTFINASDLKFCPRSYSSCVYLMMRFKGLNGKKLQNDDVTLQTRYCVHGCSDIIIKTKMIPVFSSLDFFLTSLFHKIQDGALLQVWHQFLNVLFKATQFSLRSPINKGLPKALATPHQFSSALTTPQPQKSHSSAVLLL